MFPVVSDKHIRSCDWCVGKSVHCLRPSPTTMTRNEAIELLYGVDVKRRPHEDVGLTSSWTVHIAWGPWGVCTRHSSWFQGHCTMWILAPIVTTGEMCRCQVRAKMAVALQYLSRCLTSSPTMCIFRVVAVQVWRVATRCEKVLPMLISVVAD